MTTVDEAVRVLQRRRADLVVELGALDAALSAMGSAGGADHPPMSTASPEQPRGGVSDSPAVTPGRRRRWTEEEKDAAVRLSHELGSVAAAAEKVGCNATMLSTWRSTRRQPRGPAANPEPVVEPEPEEDAQTAGHRPRVKCLECKTWLAIGVGSDRGKTLTAHAVKSPNCRDSVIRQRR